MRVPVNANQADILQVTKAAVEAAQQGRWDEVIRRYSERGSLLASGQMPTRETDELRKMDEQVRERATTAQIFLVELLNEAQVTKQRLQGLRDRIGVPNAPPESISMEA